MRTLLIGAVAAAFACQGTSPTEATVGKEFSLAPGASAAVQGTGLTISFVRVMEDSRCPIGVYCIQAGNGQVQLLVRGTAVDTLALNTTQGPHSGAVSGWTIELTALDPPRRMDSPTKPEDYRAVLTVRKAQ